MSTVAPISAKMVTSFEIDPHPELRIQSCSVSYHCVIDVGTHGRFSGRLDGVKVLALLHLVDVTQVKNPFFKNYEQKIVRDLAIVGATPASDEAQVVTDFLTRRFAAIPVKRISQME